MTVKPKELNEQGLIDLTGVKVYADRHPHDDGV